MPYYNFKPRLYPYLGSADSGFLVTYSGAKVGFAFRELRANYSGYLVLCRRTSDNTEQGFYQGATVGSLNTVRGGGGTDILTWAAGTDAKVKTWYSQINGIDLTQTTASSQPTLVSSGVMYTRGGMPVMYFDGVDDYLTLSSNVACNSYTSFIITQRTAPATLVVSLITSGGTGRGYLSYRYTDNNVYSHNSAGVVYSPQNGNTSSLEILTAYMDSATLSNSDNYANSAIFSGGNRGQVTQAGETTLTNLGYRSSSSEYGKGYVGELIYWESLRSDRLNIENDIIAVFNAPEPLFSVFQINTSATNCLRVRRSSDNTEQDIGFSSGYLDTSSLLTFVGANDGFVVKWYDQSANANHAVQTTNSKQPKIVSAGSLCTVNSKAALLFDGSDDKLDLTTGVQASIGTSFVLVGKRSASGTYGPMIGTNDNSSYSPWIYAPHSNDTYGGVVDSGYTSSSSTYTTANQEVTTMIFQAFNRLEAWVNGSSIGMSNISTLANTTDFKEIGSRSANSEYTNGYIQEIRFYALPLTGNRSTIESNIRTNFGF